VDLLLGSGRPKSSETFNTCHTVMDLYQHAQFVLKQMGPFELRVGMPPRLLSDPAQTLEAAGVPGATVVCQSSLI